MRPIKEILTEEYWNIAYRKVDENDYIFKNKNKEFETLKESHRYWYADPFLFKHSSGLWLFVEAFDNVYEKGLIACMKFDGKSFSEPQIVLEEAFHLSYPLVYEENGEIFMMPETSEDKCIQLYKAVEFPYKWEKYKVLVNVEEAVDTVKYGEKLITSIVTDHFEKRVDVDIYDKDGTVIFKGLQVNSQTARGAGRIFSVDGKKIRPAQDSTGGIYGAGLKFYRFEENGGKYYEKGIYNLSAKDFIINNKTPDGVHTYARDGGIEILDFKRRRINLRRILWILKKKL